MQIFGYSTRFERVAHLKFPDDVLPVPVYRIDTDREPLCYFFAHHAPFDQAENFFLPDRQQTVVAGLLDFRDLPVGGIYDNTSVRLVVIEIIQAQCPSDISVGMTGDI